MPSDQRLAGRLAFRPKQRTEEAEIFIETGNEVDSKAPQELHIWLPWFPRGY